MRTPTLLLPFVIAAPLLAQEPRARFHLGIGAGAGLFDFQDRDTLFGNSNTPQGGESDAGYFKFEFEGTSRRGFGGGVRYEGYRSEDDLFAKEGDAASQATVGNLFAHFTYRVQQHRFAMPVRVGLLLNGLTIEDQTTEAERSYGSIGPFFQLEPEFTVLHSGSFDWSLYGQFGLGGGGTGIEIDGDSRDYYSSTGFVGIEAGTRFHFSHFELTLAYIGRWQSMDESDRENGAVVRANDVAFQGMFLGMGVNF